MPYTRCAHSGGTVDDSGLPYRYDDASYTYSSPNVDDVIENYEAAVGNKKHPMSGKPITWAQLLCDEKIVAHYGFTAAQHAAKKSPYPLMTTTEPGAPPKTSPEAVPGRPPPKAKATPFFTKKRLIIGVVAVGFYFLVIRKRK